MKKIYYGKAVYDNKEINAVISVLRNNSLTLIDGKKVKELEKTVSKLFGKKYGLMVNSGSSANLLMILLRSYFSIKSDLSVKFRSIFFSTFLASVKLQGLKIAAFLISSLINFWAYPETPAKIGFPVEAYSNNFDGKTLLKAG